MQPSPRSTQSLLKTLPGARRSPSDDLGLRAGGGWHGASLPYLLQVPHGTAAARAKVSRASSSWRHPRRRKKDASCREFLQPAPRNVGELDLMASVLVAAPQVRTP